MQFQSRRFLGKTSWQKPRFDSSAFVNRTKTFLVRVKVILKTAFLTFITRLRHLSSKQRWALFALFLAIVSFWFGFTARNYIPVATVNGDPIDRRAYSKRLLKMSGESVLNEFIAEILVSQEAKRQNVRVTNAEINQKIEEVEKYLISQGLEEQANLSKNPKARPQLEKEIENQLLIEKLFGKNIKITDKDIEGYFAKTNVKRGEGAILESQKLTIRQLLHQQQLRQRFLTWLNLQKGDARVRVLLPL